MKKILIIMLMSLLLCSCSDSRVSDPSLNSAKPTILPTATPYIETPVTPTLAPTPELPYDDFTNMQMSSAAWMSYFEQGYEDIEYELKKVDRNYYYYTVAAAKPKIEIIDLYIYNIASGHLEFICRQKNDNINIYYPEFTELECKEIINMEQLDK